MNQTTEAPERPMPVGFLFSLVGGGVLTKNQAEAIKAYIMRLEQAGGQVSGEILKIISDQVGAAKNIAIHSAMYVDEKLYAHARGGMTQVADDLEELQGELNEMIATPHTGAS